MYDYERSLLPHSICAFVVLEVCFFSVSYFISLNGSMDSMLIRKELINHGDNIHTLSWYFLKLLVLKAGNPPDLQPSRKESRSTTSTQCEKSGQGQILSRGCGLQSTSSFQDVKSLQTEMTFSEEAYVSV